MQKGTCKGCGHTIGWIRTVKGKNIPVDLRRLTITTAEGATVSGYESHYATCPQATHFRKEKEANGTGKGAQDS